MSLASDIKRHIEASQAESLKQLRNDIEAIFGERLCSTAEGIGGLEYAIGYRLIWAEGEKLKVTIVYDLLTNTSTEVCIVLPANDKRALEIVGSNNDDIDLALSVPGWTVDDVGCWKEGQGE